MKLHFLISASLTHWPISDNAIFPLPQWFLHCQMLRKHMNLVTVGDFKNPLQIFLTLKCYESLKLTAISLRAAMKNCTAVCHSVTDIHKKISINLEASHCALKQYILGNLNRNKGYIGTAQKMVHGMHVNLMANGLILCNCIILYYSINQSIGQQVQYNFVV